MNVLQEWFRRNLSDPQVVILTTFLVVGTAIIIYFGKLLAPVLFSVVIAYLLEGMVRALEHRRVPRMVAVMLVFSLFLAALLFVLFGLLPMLSRQVVQIVQALPDVIAQAQTALMQLPERYPEYLSREQIVSVFDVLRQEQGRLGAQAVSISVASLRGVVNFVVYLVMVPLLVFFFLKDKRQILDWLSRLLPEDRRLTNQVWSDVDRQIGNYIRGKFWEILILWVATAITFSWMGLEFATLIGFFVGLSVLIPYVGALLMTVPVAIVAFSQFGFENQFYYILLAYGILQFIDGNILATLLLSGVVNLHPVAVIVALLVFGGVWGFWGVFFAIPLATLVQSVLRAWPRQERPAPDQPAVAGTA
jgi:putative permease